MLGHFNHGKTTLLDSLAGTNFVSLEKHAITQIIRTRTVEIGGRPVTIVDTPGQDIFYRMRNYGAAVADFVVLVVAVDDGICPQTEECIGVAEGIACPVVVCLNKTDLPALASSLDSRIKSLSTELQEYEILDQVPMLPMSALRGDGLDQLKSTLSNMFTELPRTCRDNTTAGDAQRICLDSISPPLASRFATVINSSTSQKDGVRLHILIRQGEIKVN